MALTSEATTVWHGDLLTGSGNTKLDSSGLAEFPVSWKARSEGVSGRTNPEELIGAAHSACFSMALSGALKRAGYTADSLQVTAAVTFDPAGGAIAGSHLLVSANIPGIAEDEFQQIAEGAKQNCPVSKALAGIPITMEASLA